ncbi:hypothetical protein COY87_00005 [Candidatus Roizmanbacteria bacterium CG_4_10_14_0_8_um_filter_33_9]|uniref:HTH cro/C1-type domain-containing protein n=1 Tax=Candidatus Roizmanbacteria bacterium CG_4_10_14_0_8_um_filter_33_9 TaxID=1974826 RepID=A0A2M7QJT7_9BACT|nr:MAG: hypothetical protein COY87_00005 [Candidatus Roizmanbacteria bacterium CG_4_10_14_0_8_um_filter_33_9]
MKDDICLKLGIRLKKTRETRGFTLKTLGRKAKLSEESVKQIESGKADPPIYNLYKLAKALNIELEQLLEGY